LLELVVVLTVLVALGGILVPVLGNYLTRSHIAACSTNVPELSKSILLFQAEKGSLPDDWESGIAGAAITAGQMFPGQPLIAAGDVINNVVHAENGIEVIALTAADVAALNAAGITSVFDHGAAAASPTFDIAATARPLAAAGNLITLTNAQAQSLGLPFNPAVAAAGDAAPQRYVVLHVGPRTTLVGRGIQEAPVVFIDEENQRPDRAYGRFAAVFQLADDNGTALAKAKYKAGGHNTSGAADDWAGLDAHLKEFYEDVRN
jgi:hypothetical protein